MIRLSRVKMNDVKTIFSTRLKALRLEKGLTQQQVGESVGTDKRSVHVWEKGSSAPSIETFCRLADVLEVDLNFLVGRSDSP